MGSAKVGNPYLQQSFYVCGAALSGLGIVTLGIDDEGSLPIDNVSRLAVRHQVDALVLDKDDLRPRLRRVAKPARPGLSGRWEADLRPTGHTLPDGLAGLVPFGLQAGLSQPR